MLQPEVSGSFGGSAWGSEPAAGILDVRHEDQGVASAGVMDSGLPGTSEGGEGGAPASAEDLALIQGLEGVVSQL